MNPSSETNRFKTYTMLPCGRRFKIPGSNFVFELDSSNGWYDEDRNYFNEDGEPTDPPEQDLEQEPRRQHHYSDEDQYENEFGRPHDDSDEEDNHFTRNLYTISTNKLNLLAYPQSKPLRINFKNVGFRTREDKFIQHFKPKIDGVLNVKFNHNEKGHNGTGHLIVKDKRTAEQIVEMEAMLVDARPIFFEIDQLQYLLINPLTNQELGVVPQYYNSKRLTEENKGEKQQQVKEVKKQQKQEEVKKTKIEEPQLKNNQKGKKQQEKLKYVFEKVAFKERNDFLFWMNEKGYELDRDFTNPQKVEKKDGAKATHATLYLRERVFLDINNTKFKDTKIVFIPMKE